MILENAIGDAYGAGFEFADITTIARKNNITQHQMPEKLKILFICTINRMRSATAQVLYENDDRFEVKSAGTDKQARIVVDRELLEWADAILVMEKHHRNKIRSKFPDIYASKKIICLYIPDEYDFMEPALMDILKTKFEDVYQRGLL